MASKFSICWDCSKATQGCSWSDYFKPVKNWTAIKYEPTSTKPYTTYLVQECPEFDRDAYNGGQIRINKNKETIYDIHSKGNL